MQSIVATASTALSHIGCAVVFLAMWHYTVQGAANLLVSVAEPEEARTFIKQAMNMFVGNASVRDLNSTHVLLFALILLIVAIITVVDDALVAFKAELSSKTLIPVDLLVKNVPKAAYDQAIASAGIAAKKIRAPMP